MFAVIIVIISLLATIFPAIYTSNNEHLPINLPSSSPDKFEVGIWATGIIISNLVIFTLLSIYVKNRFPKKLESSINRIFKFEISKKNSIIVLTIILLIYIIITTSELSLEEEWEDFHGINKIISDAIIVDRVPVEELFRENPNYSKSAPHVKYMILYASEKIFENIKILPFIGSVLLVILTYIITTKITKKRFAGIISTIVLLQSNTFLTYDTSATYSNFWAAFYLASLYFVYKFWPLSPILYIMSILSKPLSLMFFPMSMYFILRSEISKKQKIVLSIAMMILLLIISISISSLTENSTDEKFSSNEFWSGFSSFSHQLRGDSLIMLFILPLIVGLFIISRGGNYHAESLMVLIAGMLFLAPVLTGFTDQTNQPYRFIPLVVFFAVGIGMLLSKKEDG